MISAFPLPGPGERVRVVVAGDAALSTTVLEDHPRGLSWRFTAKGRARTEAGRGRAEDRRLRRRGLAYAEQGAPRSGSATSASGCRSSSRTSTSTTCCASSPRSRRRTSSSPTTSSGKVTIRLRNVPWDQALDLILALEGPGQGGDGQHHPRRAARRPSRRRPKTPRRAPQVAASSRRSSCVQLVPVNYAAAARHVGAGEGRALRARHRHRRHPHQRAHRPRHRLEHRPGAALVQNLDTQTPQVLIESRIVEANTSFSEQVGVQWGGSASAGPGHRQPTGLIFPNIVGGARRLVERRQRRHRADTRTSRSTSRRRSAPDSGGALGFVFGSAGGALALNLRLSAMENQGTVKTISRPEGDHARQQHRRRSARASRSRSARSRRRA